MGTQQTMQAHVAEDLADRLSVIIHRFEQVAVIAHQAQPFADVLKASGKCGQVELIAPPENETLNLAAHSYDAIFSLLDLHCVNDVPGYLAQCAKALKPDGLFMACFFAGDTLVELRETWLAAEAEFGGVSPRIAPMIGLREMGGLLQRAGLALPVADADRLTVRYANVLSLLREIKALGYANPLAQRHDGFTAPRLIGKLSENYRLDEDGRISATIELFWALAWKPHESQPKPKKPGSATIRLEEILKKLDDEK